MALVATDMAIEDAEISLSDVPPFEMSVVTAASSGGFEFGERELKNLWSKGSNHVSAYQSFAWFYAVNSGQISIRHGIMGPNSVIVSDQAGGLDALAMAARQIDKGIKLVVTGGMDGSICPWGWVALTTNEDLSKSHSEDEAFVPFDENATGYVPGEGGAILILEDSDQAALRGARVYGAISGYGASFDKKALHPSGDALRYAMASALAEADLAPESIGVVFADGSGTLNGDQAEAQAINDVFGIGKVPVTVPKTMTGRLNSGAGSLDIACALLSIRDSLIPPTINVWHKNSYGLDLVTRQSRHKTIKHAMVISRGSFGFNSVTIVSAP